ncbi:MAG: small multidrug resistance pump [Solirubrobacteraceae bacterium]|jgi:small multidrug resistance pump|nr:small multidrug resistance pump [Solirubrobacteraceae bacterium]
MPAWVLLSLAIAVEVAATIALRASEGFTRVVPSLIVVLGYGLAFYLLAIILRSIPVSVAYAVWSGVGTAAVAIIGMTLLGEPAGALKVASLALIVVGVIGLNLGGAH